MIKVNYTELDGPAGPTCRLEASGHAGYAPAGQDIVCAGASTLMQTLCALLAGEERRQERAWDEPDGPRLAVTAAAPPEAVGGGAFEFAKAGFALLAERYRTCPLCRPERPGRTVDGGLADVCRGR
ncbi:MAG: ribosomal-processing cysteine protease Prp [Faecalibacterium prausnitzii]